jgi:hypothetical protein
MIIYVLAGAGAGVAAIFLLEPEPGQKNFGSGYVNSLKSYKNPKFFLLKLQVEFKNHDFVAIYF